MGSADVQGELWSADPAAWAHRAESRLRPLYDDALERLKIRAGTSLLDVGCGTGLFASLAAHGDARVIGLDAAPALIEYARRHVRGAEFVVGDLEQLPFTAASFEIVTAFNSVIYASDLTRAIEEIARVTVPGGRALITVGAGSEQAACSAAINALRPAADDAAPEHTLPTEERTQRIIDALGGAGFDTIEQRDVRFSWRFADVEDAVAAQLPAGPVQEAIQRSGQAAIEQALRQFFATRANPDGAVSLDVVFACTTARRL
jgi:SAM-dependent methyltransferase